MIYLHYITKQNLNSKIIITVNSSETQGAVHTKWVVTLRQVSVIFKVLVNSGKFSVHFSIRKRHLLR